MKKVLFSMAIAAGVFIGCQDNSTDIPANQQSKVDMSDFFIPTDEITGDQAKSNQKQCYSVKVLNR